MSSSDSLDQFLHQLQKIHNFRYQIASSDNIYIQFLKSLSTKDRDNFDQFMAIYLKKAQVDIEDYTSSALGLACLQFAMEYYFL